MNFFRKDRDNSDKHYGVIGVLIALIQREIQ